MNTQPNAAPFVWLDNQGIDETVDDKRLDLLLKLQSLARMLQFRDDNSYLEPVTLQNYGVLMEELVNALLNTY